MDLISRYVHAVRTWLPEKLQADYLPELEADLRAEVQEREAELGRTLNETELGEILKRSGHPLLVATKLLPQQHLIGPQWFPVYRLALRAMIVWVLAPLYILVIGPLKAMAASNPFGAYVEAVFQLVPASLYSAAAITLVVAGLERLQLKIQPFENWDPSVELVTAAPLEVERFSRTESIIEMGVGMLCLLWWIGVIRIPSTPELTLAGAEIWTKLYWPITAITAVSVLLSTYKLLRPYWQPAYSVMNLGLQAGVITVLALLFMASPLVTVGIPNVSPDKIYRINSVVETSTHIALLAFAIVTACHFAGDVQRLMRTRGNRKAGLKAVLA